MEEVSLENVIRRCGDFNRFHFIHYILLSILNFSSSITGFYYVFGLAEPLFRCQLPSNVWPDDNKYRSYNITHRNLIDQFQYFPSKCEDANGTRCNSFVYDRSVFGRTFTEEAGYICGGSLKKTWISTAHQIGTFSVLIAGPTADRIGRRKVIQIATLAVVLISVLTQGLLQFLHMSTNTKFILLFINQVMAGLDSYSAGFLLLMELTTSSHTSFACNLTLIAYTIGEFLVAIFAYIARDWLLLKWLITLYFVVSLPYLYFIPESPYWLFSRKKYNELEVCLRKMAKLNGRSDDAWLPLYNQLVGDSRLTDTIKKEKKPVKRKILKYLPRLAISGFIEFVTMLLYTSISYGLGESNETLSPYWNFSIGVAVEIIGYLIAGVLITTPLGRKYSIILFATLTSACILAVPFIMVKYPLATTIVSQLGKLSVSSTVSVSWIYVPELFPTSMRGLANAVFVFVGSFGSILAPIFTEALGDKNIRISFYVYAGLVIILVLAICTLPETRNRSFDDGEEEEEEGKREEEKEKEEEEEEKEKHGDTNDNEEESRTKM